MPPKASGKASGKSNIKATAAAAPAVPAVSENPPATAAAAPAAPAVSENPPATAAAAPVESSNTTAPADAAAIAPAATGAPPAQLQLGTETAGNQDPADQAAAATGTLPAQLLPLPPMMFGTPWLTCLICGQQLRGGRSALIAHQASSSRCRQRQGLGGPFSGRVNCPHGCGRTVAHDDSWALAQHERFCTALNNRSAAAPATTEQRWRDQDHNNNDHRERGRWPGWVDYREWEEHDDEWTNRGWEDRSSYWQDQRWNRNQNQQWGADNDWDSSNYWNRNDEWSRNDDWDSSTYSHDSNQRWGDRHSSSYWENDQR